MFPAAECHNCKVAVALCAAEEKPENIADNQDKLYV
jgi:hypothetical protein